MKRMPRKRLIELRDTRTQKKIAKDIGITRQMLGYIESGERTPSLFVAKKIADYYEVSVEEIFFDSNGNETWHEEAVRYILPLKTSTESVEGR